jgi:CheY-like chemotaxis protein
VTHTEQATINNRRHRRWRVSGMSALVSSPSYVGAYRVQNLAAGGALLTDGALLPIGEEVELVLQLGSRPVVRVGAEVIRHQDVGARGRALAVAFRHETAETEDIVQQVALEEIERRRTPAVLVVSPSTELLQTMAGAIETLGRPVVATRTPLEAVACLSDDRCVVDTILVELAEPRTPALELLALVAESFPAVRRVVTSGSARPAQLELARLAGAAHATLRQPCTPANLRETLAAATVPEASPASP